MNKIFFQCELLSDVVLNASLATEGNMPTLDYIPGSNFLGIVAGKRYKEEGNTPEELAKNYQIFHSNEVSFGDALIAKEGFQSYALPYSLYTDKLKTDLTTENAIWVHHYLTEENLPKNGDRFIQLKQNRSGYFNANETDNYFKEVHQNFTLKSAYDREKRRSEDGKMFGFKSLKKGQLFIFYIQGKDKNLLEKVAVDLIGSKRIGKSKSAQFGQVEITQIPDPAVFSSQPLENNQLLIYAESNLCFLNEFAYGTFEPNLSEYGINGKINWEKSQIRTYSYSPWNTHRNTSNTQRDCILKGSVIIVDLEANHNLDVSKLPCQIGEYQAEGLGRILYNPTFLQANTQAFWTTKLEKAETEKVTIETVTPTSPLAKLLSQKKKDLDTELEVGQAVIQFMIKDNQKHFMSDIPASQWGGIRALATQIKDADNLKIKLWGEDETVKKDNQGFLMNGVAAERYWDKQKGKHREALLRAFIKNRAFSAAFLTKLATEMAKFKK